MEPKFKSICDSNSYYAFKNNISIISLFLPLGTVLTFSALSRYYDNILNHPKESFTRRFWKQYAILNGGIKKFKGKSINYKFKLINEKVKQSKRLISTSNYWFSPYCKNCNKRSQPDDFYIYYFNDTGDYYCNCKIVNTETKLQFLKSRCATKISNLVRKRQCLYDEIDVLNQKINDLHGEEDSLRTVPSFKNMIPILENLKENSHYKNTKSQARRLLLEVKQLSESENPIRKNINYKAPPPPPPPVNQQQEDNDTLSDIDTDTDTDSSEF